MHTRRQPPNGRKTVQSITPRSSVASATPRPLQTWPAQSAQSDGECSPLRPRAGARCSSRMQHEDVARWHKDLPLPKECIKRSFIWSFTSSVITTRCAVSWLLVLDAIYPMRCTFVLHSATLFSPIFFTTFPHRSRAPA